MEPNGEGNGNGNPAGGSEPGVLRLTQAELNAKMAENRRNLQKELEAAKAKAQAFDNLQGQVSELLGSGLIDGVEDLSDFRTKAGQTIEAFKTERQKFEEHSKKTAKELEAAKKQAEQFANRYNQAQISRTISDEAGPKAISPGALELIQLKLAQSCAVGEDGSVTVTMNVKDPESGKVGPKQMTVKEAVGLMESDVTNYGTLFKSTVNSGTGNQVVDGVKRTDNGNIDFENLDFEQFMQLQKKAPGAINKSLAGLR